MRRKGLKVLSITLFAQFPFASNASGVTMRTVTFGRQKSGSELAAVVKQFRTPAQGMEIVVPDVNGLLMA